MEIVYSDRRENRLVFAGYCDDGKILDPKQIQRMFELSGESERESSYHTDEAVTEKLKSLYAAEQERILEAISIQNSNYFEEETVRLYAMKSLRKNRE